jgi:hypothetical protein
MIGTDEVTVGAVTISTLGYVTRDIVFTLPDNIVPGQVTLEQFNIHAYFEEFDGVVTHTPLTRRNISRLCKVTFKKPFLEGNTDSTVQATSFPFSQETLYQNLDIQINTDNRTLTATVVVALPDLQAEGITVVENDYFHFNLFITLSEYTKEQFFKN